MKDLKIHFINHSSILVECNETQIIFDPWFFGKIFNNSWSLLENTDETLINYDKLKYIVVSHEHPDHFSPPTLKHIISKCKNKVNLIFPKRNNDNLKNTVEKMGFNFIESPDNEIKLYNDLFSLYFLKEGHDSAIVFKYKDFVLLNQNDAYLEHSKCQLIKNLFPKINVWLFQFSLAGFYDNKSKPDEIKTKGTEFHKNCYKKYKKIFNPDLSIPFASFVYFCKKYNNYLNDHIVDLNDLFNECEKEISVAYYNDEIYPYCITQQETLSNIKKWNQKFIDCRNKFEHTPNLSSVSKILEKAKERIQKAHDKNFIMKGYIGIEFYDYDKVFIINYETKETSFFLKNLIKPEILIGITSLEELEFLFSFPWGADTLNITGCFEYYDEQKWKNFLIYNDILYKR